MVILREDIEKGLVDLRDEGDELLPPIHPGEHIRDWLDGAGVTAYRLAKAMRIPQTRLTAILAGRRGITADTALRLAAATGISARFWLGLQNGYDLEVARRAHVADGIERLAA